MSRTNPYIDFTGTDIRPGEVVVYATRKGSTLKLNEALVLELGTKDGRPALLLEKGGGRRVWVTEFKTVVNLF